jgi:hypothetical protein
LLTKMTREKNFTDLHTLIWQKNWTKLQATI